MEWIRKGHHTGLEIVADGTAVTAVGGVAPSDDGAILFQCREGVASGEDLGDAGLELSADAAAVTAIH